MYTPKVYLVVSFLFGYVDTHNHETIFMFVKTFSYKFVRFRTTNWESTTIRMTVVKSIDNSKKKLVGLNK